MRQKKKLPEVSNGTKFASNALHAVRGSILQLAQNTNEVFTAKLVMDVNMDLKVLDLELVLVPFQWILELMVTNQHTKNH